MHGSGNLSRWLFDNHLVDEITLLTYPVVVGQGTRLVNDSMEPLRQGWPGGMKCRPVCSPAQSAIAAQASSGPLSQPWTAG